MMKAKFFVRLNLKYNEIVYERFAENRLLPKKITCTYTSQLLAFSILIQGSPILSLDM
mgnify:CR=1 FL=1